MKEMLQDFFFYLKYEKNVSENTLNAYVRDISHFVDFLDKEKINIKNFKREDWQKYLSSLYEEYKVKSITRKISAIRSFFKFLVREGYVKKNYSSFIQLPRIPLNLPEVLNKEDMEKFLSLPDLTSLIGIRNQAILETFYATGVRVSELVGLNLESVDLQEGYIRCFGKGSKERIVLLGDYAKESLKRYLDVRSEFKPKDDKALFLNKNGSRISRQGVWYIIKTYARILKLPEKVSPHTFRHTFATHLLSQGADIRIVQELLGHSDISTTQIYTHVVSNELHDVYRKAHPLLRRNKDEEGYSHRS
ncbi:MAG TPA: site-specific tyrosine recombinase XerD [Dictyoglomaceae bacterium]|nr:site-specific tyrosine recombinase XerD [Dictyoglomaceae bacterium]HOL39115.1 site-specific tyrosine recombinase XerD [Dictyoglomaceae bacterium]HPP15269.1 site-specific tyrosine recombinase XerD [Dictyoglomaceae bacterium]